MGPGPLLASSVGLKPLDLTYVLPLRWNADADTDELTFYLRWLSTHVDEVIVVDGSASELFDSHNSRWGGSFTHVAPDPTLRFRNGKVNGVTTGVRAARHDRVVIADDDVRYDRAALERMFDLLTDHELVRPQNFFDPLPWHAAWDTARTLLNRAFGADYPGTLGVRKEMFQRTGGYDGDVMFENLELMRTVVAAGGRTIAPLDLYVRRLPPETAHFVGQRVRQAYDEFALPARLALWLSIVPAVGMAVATRSTRALIAGAGFSIGVAELGRRRAGGSRVFPAYTSLFAPAWLLERGLCSWAAVAQRLTRGGVAYRDGVLEKAATPVRELQERLG
jgi:hypothetical protein